MSGADLPFTFSTFYVVLLASPTSSEEGLYDISNLFGESDREHSSDTLKRHPPLKLNEVDSPRKEYRCKYVLLCFASGLWRFSDLLHNVSKCVSELSHEWNLKESSGI